MNGDFFNFQNNKRIEKQWMVRMFDANVSLTLITIPISKRNREIPAAIGRSPFTPTVLACSHCQIGLNMFNMIISTACGVK